MAITTQILLTTSKAAPYGLSRHLRPKEDSREVLFSSQCHWSLTFPKLKTNLCQPVSGSRKRFQFLGFTSRSGSRKKLAGNRAFFGYETPPIKTGISPKPDRFSVSSDLLGLVFGRTWATYKGRASFCRDRSKLLHQFCPILTTDMTYKWFKSYNWPSILMTFILYLA